MKEISDKKYQTYLKMVNFMNNLLPMIISAEQLEICKKYLDAGRLSQDDLEALVNEK